MNIVTIGSSGHIEYALDSYKKVLNCRITGYSLGSADEEFRPDAEHNLKQSGAKYFKNYRKMLDVLKPDVAVINPHYYLCSRIIAECLGRGIHCFAEKPLALNEEDLNKIEEQCHDSKLSLNTMMYYRYHPAFYACWQAVKEGSIGEPVLILAQKSYKIGKKPLWTQERAKFGGLIPWVGAHAIDLIHWICGDIWEEVMAVQSLKGNRENGELESAAICTYKLQKSTLASVSMDYLRPESAGIHGDDRIRIAGTKGILEVMNEKAVLVSDEGGQRELPLEKERSVFLDFLEHISLGNPIRNPMKDIFRVHQVIIRSQIAADTGEKIKLV